jgi:RNA polymerase sigma factor (sigma-70 family)
MTLVNLVKDDARRRHLVPRPTDAVDMDQSDPSNDAAEAIVARERLEELLSGLPPKQRAAVVLRVIEGLSEAETATLLDCSTGTVKSNLARGLDRIRDQLAAVPQTMQEDSS